MKVLLCLFAVLAVIYAEDGNEGTGETAESRQSETRDDPNNAEVNMCQLDQVASILCDICVELETSISRGQCCADENVMYRCEKVVTSFMPKEDSDYYNTVENDIDTKDWNLSPKDKRASWSWKKPTANRLNNARYDLGYRGKRFSSTGRYSWKPTNYRLDRIYDTGYRGKRMDSMDYYDPELVETDGLAKRRMPGRWDWKPAAYLLDNPYRYDRINYMGKRAALNWKPANYDSRYDVDPDYVPISDMEKKAVYPGRYDWKPAAHRFEPQWDVSGKRTLWYGRRPTGRYEWKPYSLYGEDMEKRGVWDWKPAANRLNNRWGDNFRYVNKRFNLGPGRWNWKPADSSSKFTSSSSSQGKRGRYDYRPSGYYGYGSSSDTSGELQYDRAPAAQYDWKPAALKRSRYTQSWKPWKPATYYGNFERVWG